MQELNHLCSGAQEVEQAGCEFSLPLALMADALNDNHRAVGGPWLGQHARAEGRACCALPTAGHIARVRQSSLLHKAAGGWPRKIGSVRNCQGEQTLGFAGEACFWESCCLLDFFPQERLLHFAVIFGVGVVSDPSPGCSRNPAGWGSTRHGLPPCWVRSRSWVSPEPSACCRCWAAE